MVNNFGDINVTDTAIHLSSSDNSMLIVNNSGNLTVNSDIGIDVEAGSYSNISIDNQGDIDSVSAAIHLYSSGNSIFTVNNSGNLATQDNGITLYAESDNNIIVNNQGNMDTSNSAINLYYMNNSTAVINNSGKLTVESGAGIELFSDSDNSITVNNEGTINAKNGAQAIMISMSDDSTLNLNHSGKIQADTGGAVNLEAGVNSQINFIVSGEILAGSDIDTFALYAKNRGTTDIALASGWEIDGTVQVINADLNDSSSTTLTLSGDDNSTFDLTRLRDYTSTTTGLDRDGFYGFGHLVKGGASSWELTGRQTEGALKSASIESGELILNNATLLLDDEASMTIEAAGQLTVIGDSVVQGNLNNSGHIGREHEGDGFTTLTITGDYHGEEGSYLTFNGQLGDDTSPIDKVIIQGDASGTSQVTVNNLGGLGAQTVEGIEIINIQGVSDAEFEQSGRIVSGAYDYHLTKGDDNWYLTSSDNSKANPDELSLRPEASSYIDNLATANTLFLTRLYDRSGETQYVDAMTGEVRNTSMWMRTAGGHNQWRVAGGNQLKTTSNRYVVQLGGDLLQFSLNGVDKWRLGVMAGHGSSKSKTSATVSGHHSRGKVTGYSAGVYGTWYADAMANDGLYVDTWLQYNWFNNDINGDGLAGESYNAKGLTASVEVGYTHLLHTFGSEVGNRNDWHIQPQAQVIFMGVKSRDFREHNGTLVSSDGEGNVMTRLGFKTYLSGSPSNHSSQPSFIQPFAEINWLHNTRNFSVQMDGERASQGGTKNQGEGRLGFNSAVTKNFNIWSSVAMTFGADNYHDTVFAIGGQYQF